MPFAQVHYPFENKEWFESHFPGDFIVEYVGQTRGWFYTLMVLSTALFDKAPFRNCICHGIVLDENKQKLSKRLKNYPDPIEVFDDLRRRRAALVHDLVAAPVRRRPRHAEGRPAPSARPCAQVLLPLWNAYSFFTLYANIDGITRQAASPTRRGRARPLHPRQDRASWCAASSGAWTGSTSPAPATRCRRFIEALNNWYIRRSRERFWKAEKDADKRDAYDTLYTVLVTLCADDGAVPAALVARRSTARLTGERACTSPTGRTAAQLPADAGAGRRDGPRARGLLGRARAARARTTCACASRCAS